MAGRENEWQILKAVNDSELPVGAVHLSEKLGIPPANIGRTLLQLEKKGFVKKVQNKGRSITELGRKCLEEELQKTEKLSAASELIDLASMGNGDNLLEILAVRKLLESYTARQCAANVTEEMIKELEDIQFDYVYELRHGHSGSEQDLRLHLKIAEYSGNQTIVRILRLLLTDNNSYAEFTKAAISRNHLSQKEHEPILEAIRNHDAEQAALEMEAHLDRVMRNVEYHYGKGELE